MPVKIFHLFIYIYIYLNLFIFIYLYLSLFILTYISFAIYCIIFASLCCSCIFLISSSPQAFINYFDFQPAFPQRKEKEFRDLMKKEMLELKMNELQRKKQERAKRRWNAESKSRKRHSGGKEDHGSSKRLDSKKDEPRHCLGPGCVNAARNGSKYCGDECGVQLALRSVNLICQSV